MSKYYERCRRLKKCSRYGCTSNAQDENGHLYTKCAKHRARDAYRIRMVRSAQPSQREYEKYLAKKRKAA